MKGPWRFLTVGQVLAIHRLVVAEFGGESTVLDQGLLESAVAMPAAGFGDRLLHEGAPAIAGAYLYHICRGRPFLDGNKRSALAAAGTFLLANDIRVKATQKELVQITLGVAEGRVSKDEVVAFFRDHCRSPRSL